LQPQTYDLLGFSLAQTLSAAICADYLVLRFSHSFKRSLIYLRCRAFATIKKTDRPSFAMRSTLQRYNGDQRGSCEKMQTSTVTARYSETV
jgi:hypothetical protein